MVNLDYPALRAYFPESTTLPSPLLVSDAVCQIRRSKLPDPKELPNVGSFFKNPIVSAETLNRIQEEEDMLNNKPKEEKKNDSFKGFAERRSR